MTANLNVTSVASISLHFSSTIRLTRQLVHVMILFLFVALLTFINGRHSQTRKSNRPFSHLSRFFVSICLIGLVINDLLVINGVTHRRWCSIHHFSLHFLLVTIVVSRLLPDFYECSNRYYYQDDVASLKSSVMFTFFLLILIQLFISIKWLWKNENLPLIDWNPPIFCPAQIRPQLFIFFLHIFELIFVIQSLHSFLVLNQTNNTSSPSSLTMMISERLCQLNSILLRLFYFLCTSILQIFFWPGQFSATLYAAILVVESTMIFIIVVFHSSVRYEQNLSHHENERAVLDTAYLRIKQDEFNDDTRLLNDID